MNIKHLTEFLMAYVSAMEDNNTDETERLNSFNLFYTVNLSI